MTAPLTSHRRNIGVAPGKALNVALWCVQVLLALTFLNASTAKLMGRPEMVQLFAALGMGQWLRYVTGILELTGAVLIVVPKSPMAPVITILPVLPLPGVANTLIAPPAGVA